MKILAVSDEVVDFIYSTRIREKYADVDLVIGCGDLPFYYLEFIVSVLSVPVYYVPGNHDKPEQYLSNGRIARYAEGCEQLDGAAARFSSPRVAGLPKGGLFLAGLGGSLRYNQGTHQYSQEEMFGRALALSPALTANRLRYGRYLDILVTHAPPRGIHDCPDKTHTGFNAFLSCMNIFEPRFLLHGHTHLYRPDTIRTSRYRRTEVLNVYPYRLIEWEPEHDRP